jgi:N-acetylgalactosamine-6-sulfatase
LILAVAPQPSFVQAAERPNIVFIFADDLGYGDLGCYGHPYARTPHLDGLADEGSRFLQFYVTGVTCCPSRTGFMTSRHPAEYAVYPAVGGFGDRITVTQLLKLAGYATGHFGKWHIGPDTQPGTYGIEVIDVLGGDRQDERGRDAPIFDAAIRFIEQHRDRPFYVNVWGHMTHHAVTPPQSYVDRFRDLTVNQSDFPAPMHEKFATCEARGGDVSECMRNYLAEVSALDDSVGRLLTRLDELGLRDNTIVVFSSDHGSPAIPMTERTNRRRRNRQPDSDPQRFALTLNLMGFNGALRGGKHGMYEGGVRVPFIIRWPGHVPTGRVDEESVISGIDWLPTLCRIAGVDIDAAQFEGEDVSACWLGEAHTRTHPLLWKTSSPGSPTGMRDGEWKLIHPTGRRGEDELYDLAADPGEELNVAAEQPDVVARLSAVVEAWTGTLPAEYVKDGVEED